MTKNNHNISDTVMRHIKQERIYPYPRYVFVLLFASATCLLLLLLILGVFGLALFVHHATVGFGMMHKGFGLGMMLPLVLSLIWGLLLCGFLYLMYQIIPHLGKAYRYSVYIIIGGLFVLMVIGAMLVSLQFGPGDRFDKRFAPHMPGYKHMQERMHSQPRFHRNSSSRY